jgi:hypothetical protein
MAQTVEQARAVTVVLAVAFEVLAQSEQVTHLQQVLPKVTTVAILQPEQVLVAAVVRVP